MQEVKNSSTATFELRGLHRPTVHYALIGMLLVLFLAFAPLAAAMGSAGSYSGDDEYDPAAGGLPAVSTFAVVGSYSGDDKYDPAAGGLPAVSTFAAVAGNYSGDDEYDPAAGGLPAVFAAADCDLDAFSVAGGFSGDDEYDPAAGGNPERFPDVLVCASFFGGTQ